MPYVKHIDTSKCNPYNLLNYIHNAKKTLAASREDAIPKAGCLLSDTPAEMAVEMDLLKKSYPEKTNYKRQYAHIEISYLPGDGEKAGEKLGLKENEVYREHLNRVMNDPEFAGFQWDAALHLNRAHPHWHVAVNTMKTDGTLIKTHYLQEALREVSDRHAQELGLNIITAKQHTAMKSLNQEEYRAKEEGRMLIVTQLRLKAAEVLKQSEANTLYGLQQEFEQHGIKLSRTGDEGGLVYKYNDRYFPASRLGKVFQLYGLKQTLETSFEAARRHIESLPKEVRFRDLNMQARDGSYTLLSIGDERPQDDRRELISILANTRLAAKSISEYREELAALGVEAKGDSRFVYRFEDQSYSESSLQRQFRKESLGRYFEEKDRGSAGGATREFQPTLEEESIRKPALEEVKESVSEQEQSVKPHVQQDDRRR